ncbi:MAG: RNase adapter RapZ [Nitrospiraceae bacterium]|nr:RNase adapter RapZ [Nitrospiraceae bacterium]
MKPAVFIITGLSGSGKTVALKALEDSGFFCVDNLPPQLIDDFIRISSGRKESSGLGIGIDAREKEFLAGMEPTLERLKEKYEVKIIFLLADEAVLIRRYKETRRPHPVPEENIEASIGTEMKLLEPLRARADRIIDTTALTPHQLRELTISTLGLRGSVFQTLVVSFGFKFGLPQSADLVVDARFIPNPYFVTELKNLSGRDQPVIDFVSQNNLTREFVERLDNLLSFLVPHYIKEGKSSLTIAIGCTGGRHRSPVIADMLASRLKALGVPVTVVHRDM